LNSLIVISVVAFCILLLLLFGASVKPLKWIGQACIKLIVGALLLFFFNMIGSHFSLHIPINFITAAVSGFLGLPGLAALVAIDQLILQ